MKLVFISTAMILTLSPVNAQTSDRYTYDALGRLTATETRRTGGGGAQTAYHYDLSSNRKNIQSSGAFKGPILDVAAELHRGEALLSKDTRFKFVMQFDGDLALYDENDTLMWHTGTTTGNFAAMQADGNFVVYDANGRAVWNTQTNGAGESFLIVQPDGNVVVYREAGPALWATSTCCH